MPTTPRQPDQPNASRPAQAAAAAPKPLVRAGGAPTDPAALEQQVRRRIDTLSYLPTTVAVAMKFVQLGRDAEADPADYACVVASDTSLSTKLLALANSSWFGVRNKVTKPQVAVNLLGLGTVRTLAISYCITGLHHDLRLSPDESRRLWQASLCKAVAAKQYAATVHKDLAEEAFAAGLFQDLAMSVLYASAPDRVEAMLEDAAADARARLEREREMFRLDHAEVGRAIAQKLELPELFVDAIAFHHDHARLREFVTGNPGDAGRVLADAAYVASLFPHRLSVWNRADGDELRRFLADPGSAGRVASPERFLDSVQQEFNQLCAYFEQGGEPDVVLTELLISATREAADHATQLVRTVHGLMQQNLNAGEEVQALHRRRSELEAVATRDGLTGALNREGLAARVAEFFGRVQRYQLGFAVAYFDLDRFKSINDTGGHASGDAALKALAAIVTQSTRTGAAAAAGTGSPDGKGCDFLARVGGDEFVLFLDDCCERDATQIVDKILAAVAREPVGQSLADGFPLQMSASVGLLWVPPGAGPLSLDTVLSQADKLMYTAKRAGGNCLRRGTFSASASAAA